MRVLKDFGLGEEGSASEGTEFESQDVFQTNGQRN